MISREAIANTAALDAFEAAMRQNQGLPQAKSLATHAWLSHEPGADTRQARAIIEELVSDAKNSEVTI